MHRYRKIVLFFITNVIVISILFVDFSIIRGEQFLNCITEISWVHSFSNDKHDLENQEPELENELFFLTNNKVGSSMLNLLVVGKQLPERFDIKYMDIYTPPPETS